MISNERDFSQGCPEKFSSQSRSESPAQTECAQPGLETSQPKQEKLIGNQAAIERFNQEVIALGLMFGAEP